MEQDLKSVAIWNVKFNLLTSSEIASVVNSWILSGKKGYTLLESMLIQ